MEKTLAGAVAILSLVIFGVPIALLYADLSQSLHFVSADAGTKAVATIALRPKQTVEVKFLDSAVVFYGSTASFRDGENAQLEFYLLDGRGNPELMTMKRVTTQDQSRPLWICERCQRLGLSQTWVVQ